MEGKFTEFMIAELRELLSDLEAGLEPSNIVLHEVVTAECGRQYRRSMAVDETQGDLKCKI